jgi:membrane-bound lytic murein transglycosylase D
MIKRAGGILLFLTLFITSFHAFSGPANRFVNTRGDDPDYKKALEALQNKVPLTYNESVRSFINLFATTQKKRFGKMLGLAKYYFPIYEKIFKERGVPDELKYLSIIESSLDMNAVSKAQAAGPWQFMNEVGKKYGLAVNDSVDERRDPSMACNAAASYLLDSYKQYGDWLVALASYNCSRNSIKWAMEDAGGKTDYWSIRKYLPLETQSYVPIFIATVYMMNNYWKHDIVPEEPKFITETEIIAVTKSIKLDDIAAMGGLNPYILYNLNPSYKKQVVNGSSSAPKGIVLPVLPTYTYNAICRMAGAPERIIAPAYQPPPPVPVLRIIYRVQEGDTLAGIAAKFPNDTVDNIRKVNGIKGDKVELGAVLLVKE